METDVTVVDVVDEPAGVIEVPAQLYLQLALGGRVKLQPKEAAQIILCLCIVVKQSMGSK